MTRIPEVMHLRKVSLASLTGVALSIAGGALVAFAAGRYAIGAYRADEARRAWDELEARAQVVGAQRFAERSSALQAGVGAPVARLRIPSLALDEIVLEGVGDDELNAGPGHLPGSALPGAAGNAIISAHRDRHFRRLDRLRIGDTITTESAQSSGSWVVIGRQVVGRGTPALFASQEPTLTLTTCWPIQYLGTAPDRLIVTAKPLNGTWIAGLPLRSGGGS